jgi:hypothetical protein
MKLLKYFFKRFATLITFTDFGLNYCDQKRKKDCLKNKKLLYLLYYNVSYINFQFTFIIESISNQCRSSCSNLMTTL